MEFLMKNFKNLTLLVAMATVSTSVVSASDALDKAHTLALAEVTKATLDLGARINANLLAIADAAAAKPKSWMPTLPTITLPKMPTISMPSMPKMPTMPTLAGMQSGLTAAGSAVVAGSKVAMDKVVSSATTAQKAVVDGSLAVVAKAKANPKTTAGIVAALVATAGTVYALRARNAAHKAAEVVTPVVETAPVVEATVEAVTPVVEATVVDLNAQAAQLSPRELVKFAKLSAAHKAAALTQVARLNDSQIAYIG